MGFQLIEQDVDSYIRQSLFPVKELSQFLMDFLALDFSLENIKALAFNFNNVFTLKEKKGFLSKIKNVRF